MSVLSTSDNSGRSPSASNIDFKAFRRKLLAWYRKHSRDLPWRATHAPYAIWVSEIMLQQTQVATVLPYYRRFLESFPDVKTLAEADEHAVLKHWEGLGYYRRARQLHAAAKRMVDLHDGKFPTDFDQVLDLPGIGRYTAGAICSFAYDQSRPIVEANTQRLYARLLRLDQPLDSKTGQASLWSFAESILPKSGAGEINSAVMELGALVCLPKPQCDACPIAELCPTKRDGLQDRIPLPKKKTLYEDRFEVALIVRDKQGRFRMRRCPPGEWWEGLWDFPRFEVKPDDWGGSDLPNLVGSVHSFGRDAFTPARKLFSLKHSVTKYRITLTCFSASKTLPSNLISPPRPVSGRGGRGVRGREDELIAESIESKVETQTEPTAAEMRWISCKELQSLPLSTSGRKVADRLLKMPAKPVNRG